MSPDVTAGPAGPERLPQHVRIAVLTYQRPEDIGAALPPLVEQARSVTTGTTTADIVVVDNDPAASARELVTRFAAAHPDVGIRYEHEATPGIAAARNRALSTAGDSDLLVFIDDDERPSAHWLALLLQTYAEHGSAAVVGPVVSEFAVDPEAWISDGRFFDRLRRPTGSLVEVAATNNLMLDLHQITALGLTFDQEFGLSGGSDTLFTRRLHQLGGRLVWCDEAVVTDVVPASRATRSWVLRRALRSGNSWSRTSLTLSQSPLQRGVARLELTGRGLARLAGAGARVGVGVITRSQGQRARGARTFARSIGMMSGAWGYVYQEYRRKPEPPASS